MIAQYIIYTVLYNEYNEMSFCETILIVRNHIGKESKTASRKLKRYNDNVSMLMTH